MTLRLTLTLLPILSKGFVSFIETLHQSVLRSNLSVLFNPILISLGE